MGHPPVHTFQNGPQNFHAPPNLGPRPSTSHGLPMMANNSQSPLRMYTLRKSQRTGWSRSTKEPLDASPQEMSTLVQSQQRSGRQALDLVYSLKPNQQEAVLDALADCNEEETDPRFKWSIEYFRRNFKNIKSGFLSKEVCMSVDIILMRKLRNSNLEQQSSLPNGPSSLQPNLQNMQFGTAMPGSKLQGQHTTSFGDTLPSKPPMPNTSAPIQPNLGGRGPGGPQIMQDNLAQKVKGPPVGPGPQPKLPGVNPQAGGQNNVVPIQPKVTPNNGQQPRPGPTQPPNVTFVGSAKPNIVQAQKGQNLHANFPDSGKKGGSKSRLLGRQYDDSSNDSDDSDDGSFSDSVFDSDDNDRGQRQTPRSSISSGRGPKYYTSHPKDKRGNGSRRKEKLYDTPDDRGRGTRRSSGGRLFTREDLQPYSMDYDGPYSLRAGRMEGPPGYQRRNSMAETGYFDGYGPPARPQPSVFYPRPRQIVHQSPYNRPY